jgi:hypothetical protein
MAGVAVRPGDDYQISATWEVRRSTSQPSLLIEFEGMAPDGGSCLPLKESYGCQVRGREAVGLYFRRPHRGHSRWKQELVAFVQSLDEAGSA